MKRGIWFFVGLLILTVMIAGCTSQSNATAPALSPQTVTPQLSVASQAPAQSPQLIGTNWKLGWYDDTKGMWSSVIAGSSINAIFSSDEKMSGAGGCNPYISVYHLGTPPKIVISRPAVPDSQCQSPTGVNSQESAYYTDLERADTYSITDGQLLIFDNTGKKILQFDRT
jgi:heat shock protein HslJ